MEDVETRWRIVSAALALLLVGAVVGCVVLWRDRTDLEDLQDRVAAEAAATEEAERIVVAWLTYDYRSFDEDVVEAESYMTTEQAAEHSDLMNLLRDSAVAQKTIVEAQLQGSGVARVNGDMAEILVMVNQLTEKTGTEPFLLPVWATLRMVHEDGEWLVDEISNEGAGG